MFKIQLSPVGYTGATTQISVSGTTLTYNNAPYDFAALPVGGQVQAEYPAIGTIKNVDGVIELELAYKYDDTTAEPMQSTNPNDWLVIIAEGNVPSPVVLKPTPSIEVPNVQSF